MTGIDVWPRWSGPAGLVVVLGVDGLRQTVAPGLALSGLLDEAAHLATAIVAVAALRGAPRSRFVLAALVSSVLIDTDHVPASVFGWDLLTDGTPRPYSHSLLSVLLALALAAGLTGRRRALAAGIGFGIAAHLLRDLSTGPGVALLWPASWSAVTVPYLGYVAAVTALALAGVRRRAGPPGSCAHALATARTRDP